MTQQVSSKGFFKERRDHALVRVRMREVKVENRRSDDVGVQH